MPTRPRPTESVKKGNPRPQTKLPGVGYLFPLLSGVRRRGDRHGLHDPNDLHASASLAGNGHNADDSSSHPRKVGAAMCRLSIHTGRVHFPNSLPAKHSLGRALRGELRVEEAVACVRCKCLTVRLPEP